MVLDIKVRERVKKRRWLERTYMSDGEDWHLETDQRVYKSKRHVFRIRIRSNYPHQN